MDRDRRLAELMGMCWHEMDRNPLNPHLMCAKCQKMWRDIPDNPDFSTPEWRARLRDFCAEWDEWPRFVEWAYAKYREIIAEENMKAGDFMNYLWRNLATLIVEYHGEGR